MEFDIDDLDPIRSGESLDPRPDNRIYVDTVRRAQGVSAFSVEPDEDLLIWALILHPRTEEFPWAGDALAPEEFDTEFDSDAAGPRPLRKANIGDEADPKNAGDPISFDEPHTVPDGYNWELVQMWGNFSDTVFFTLWGDKPSVDTPTSIDDFEPMGPLWLEGRFVVENHERVAEPTERALTDPTFDGDRYVAATLGHHGSVDEPIYGKLFIAAVQREIDQ